MTHPMNDPFQYIGRVTSRDTEGRVRTLEVFYPEDEIVLSDGDEFITFVTVTGLEGNPE